MNKPLDEQYFIWLCGQVGSVDDMIHPSRTYWGILKYLFTKEFIWIVDRDDNRAIDGLELRKEFLYNEQISSVDSDWFHMPCSMLEMFIGLSRRLAFEDDGEPSGWFWTFMENLGLELYNDEAQIPASKVNRILDDVNFRTYRSNGRGGLFPLKYAHEDQRDVEYWYQAHAYLLEAS